MIKYIKGLFNLSKPKFKFKKGSKAIVNIPPFLPFPISVRIEYIEEGSFENIYIISFGDKLYRIPESKIHYVDKTGIS